MPSIDLFEHHFALGSHPDEDVLIHRRANGISRRPDVREPVMIVERDVGDGRGICTGGHPCVLGDKGVELDVVGHVVVEEVGDEGRGDVVLKLKLSA